MSELRLAPIIGVIPTVKDVVIKPFPPDNPDTPKGKNTWNWLFPENIAEGRVVIVRRFKDAAAGNHFHPRAIDKDPEKFLLISGRLTFRFRDLFGGYLEKELDAERSGLIEVQIPPYVFHTVTVLSDYVWFLEQRTVAFDPKTNYSAEEFEFLSASLKK